MRILFIRSNSCNPDVRVEKEIRALLEMGLNIDILCWNRDENHKFIQYNKTYEEGIVTFYTIGIKATFGGGLKNNLIPLLKFQTKIIKHMRKNKYDVIHSCDFDTGFTSYILKGKSKYVYDVFDYYVDSFNVPKALRLIIESLECFICNHCDALILCTEERKNQIKKLYQKNIIYIHNSPIPIEINQNIKDKSDILRIVYIGILGEGRMLKELLHICSREKKFELHIGGFGILEPTIKDYANKYENITYYGKIPYEKTLRIESDCDVMLALYDINIKNHIFAAPNKFYEALYLGKPLIMIKNSGMSNIVSDKKIGLLINYEENQLQKALYTVLRDIDSWRSKEKLIKNIYQTKYSWNVMNARLKKLYKGLM